MEGKHENERRGVSNEQFVIEGPNGTLKLHSRVIISIGLPIVVGLL